MSRLPHPDRGALRETRGLPLLALVAALVLVALAAELAVGAAGWSWPLVRALRLPRAAAAAGAGALLAEAGLAMQLVLRNPLADPYVLGASGGAGTGAIAMLLLGGQLWLGSVAGAVVALGLLLWLGRHALAGHGDEAPAQLILVGAMLSALFGAASALMLALVPDAGLRGAVFWLLGDLSGATQGPLLCGLAVILGLGLAWRARSLDRLALGAEQAWLLGEPVRRLRLVLVLLAAAATGATVAQAGAIGFIGLVVPQALRLLGVRRASLQAWAAPGCGAALLLAADAVARGAASPYELPVGAVTALLGAPAFIAVLARQARGGRA